MVLIVGNEPTKNGAGLPGLLGTTCQNYIPKNGTTYQKMALHTKKWHYIPKMALHAKKMALPKNGTTYQKMALHTKMALHNKM
jgi:hypothetical protein